MSDDPYDPNATRKEELWKLHLKKQRDDALIAGAGDPIGDFFGAVFGGLWNLAGHSIGKVIGGFFTMMVVGVFAFVLLFVGWISLKAWLIWCAAGFAIGFFFRKVFWAGLALGIVFCFLIGGSWLFSTFVTVHHEPNPVTKTAPGVKPPNNGQHRLPKPHSRIQPKSAPAEPAAPVEAQ